MSASGYGGPPAITLSRAFGSWQLAPVVVALVVLGAAWYLLALRRLRARGEPWKPSRTFSYLLGLAVWLIATCSALGVYEKTLFTARAAQIVLLLLLTPMLVAMGAPVTLLVESCHDPARRERIRRRLNGRVSKVLMFPAVSTVLIVAPPWIVYYSPWYDLALRSTGYNILLHVALVGLGLGYFWPRLQLDPVGREYPFMVSFFLSFVEVIFDGALGMLLMFGHHLIAENYYAGLHRPWGMSLRQDQVWGGGVFWVLGDVAGVPFLCAMIYRFFHDEREKARRVDAQLDREEAALRAARAAAAGDAGPGGPTPAAGAVPATTAAATPEAVEEPVLMRPWWETDARLARRFGGAREPDTEPDA